MNKHEAHTGCSHEQSEHDPAEATDNPGCCAEVDVESADQKATHGCCCGAAQAHRRAMT